VFISWKFYGSYLVITNKILIKVSSVLLKVIKSHCGGVQKSQEKIFKAPSKSSKFQFPSGVEKPPGTKSYSALSLTNFDLYCVVQRASACIRAAKNSCCSITDCFANKFSYPFSPCCCLTAIIWIWILIHFPVLYHININNKLFKYVPINKCITYRLGPRAPKKAAYLLGLDKTWF